MKKYWRCHVCNDIHYGDRPPSLCPTCGAKNGFCQVDRTEAWGMESEEGRAIDSEEAVVAAWTAFANASTEFKLNAAEEDVRLLARGVLENMHSKGLKYCPCRMTMSDPVGDLKLVCPCGFKVQQVYREDGTCWCGLFVKR